MYKPDKAITEKIRRYDPALFLKWNHRSKFFELWRKKTVGSVMVTPVTESIYDTNKKRVFTPLDERLLWWLYYADSWKNGGSKNHALLSDKRWHAFNEKLDQNRRRDNRDRAKDFWYGINSFYTTKHSSKNGPPSFNTKTPQRQWVDPDTPTRNQRIFQRSRQNAQRYNY